MKKTDEITIKITGDKKFRQMIMDKIYETLMEEDLLEESTKPGNGYNLESTISPSDEVM